MGSAPLNITGFQLTNGPAFNFGSITCGGSLAPLASCVVNITFNWQYAFGQSFTTLRITDNASRSPQSIGLTGSVLGQGLASTAAGLTLPHPPLATQTTPQHATLM